MLMGLVGFDDRRRLILLPPALVESSLLSLDTHRDNNPPNKLKLVCRNSLQTPRTARNYPKIGGTIGSMEGFGPLKS